MTGSGAAGRRPAYFPWFVAPAAMQEALVRLDGPVLLVDDLVDSRWTLTVAGRALRVAGADEVLPFALASVG